MSLALPPDHPPIPTTSSSPFPTAPPAGVCPAASLLSATRPSSPAVTPSSTANGTALHANGVQNGGADEGELPYAGQVFTLGTRNSKLAMVQTEIVRRELEQRWPGCEIRIFGMTTLGDNVQTQPLYTFGGKALWTKELEVHLLDGSVDAIVHSLKDVPTEFPPGCKLGAVLEREDPSDALVVKAGLHYTSLEEMPEGSVIGTSSVRRVAQLRRKFPGLKFADVRGNLGTRLKKLDDPSSSYTALILASAGLIRIGLGSRITAAVTSPNLYHAVGQGAIGVEIRQDDPRAEEIIGSLECWKTSWRTRAERRMLAVLEGGCSVPVGCETKITEVWVKGGEGDDHQQQHLAKDADHIPASEPLLPVSPSSSQNGALPLPSTSPSKSRPIVSPRARTVALPPHSSSSLSRSPNFPSSPPASSTLGISSFHSAAGISPDVDETQGIPSGHPAVNPSFTCPVTGRRLPSPPPVALSHMEKCTHRPGSPPLCAGKHAGASHHATLELTGTITSLSGTHAVIATAKRRIHCIEDAELLGEEVARELVEGGGKDILTELGRHVKEVGGPDSQHDGKEVGQGEKYVVPGGANTAPHSRPTVHHVTPSELNVKIPPGETNESAPIACPVFGNGALEDALSKSPNGGVMGKSPHGRSTVFKQGEVCLRPAGW
ncbi:hypothetical protein JCM8547_008685 [Rhodosporidiobolus lusitaniae]